MKHKISAILILSLILSMLLMPLAVSADNGKSIIKNMVQAPADYSVGINPDDYIIWDLYGRGVLGYSAAYYRAVMNLPDWVFLRFG